MPLQHASRCWSCVLPMCDDCAYEFVLHFGRNINDSHYYYYYIVYINICSEYYLFIFNTKFKDYTQYRCPTRCHLIWHLAYKSVAKSQHDWASSVLMRLSVFIKWKSNIYMTNMRRKGPHTKQSSITINFFKYNTVNTYIVASAWNASDDYETIPNKLRHRIREEIIPWPGSTFHRCFRSQCQRSVYTNIVYVNICAAEGCIINWTHLSIHVFKFCVEQSEVLLYKYFNISGLVLLQQNFRQNFTRKFRENFGTKVWNFLTKLSRESFGEKFHPNCLRKHYMRMIRITWA